MKPSFEAGEVVYNSLSGKGIILGEWGNWVDTDERGIEMAINGAGIYDLQFKSGEMRSVNVCWRSRWHRQAKIGSKTCMATSILVRDCPGPWQLTEAN